MTTQTSLESLRSTDTAKIRGEILGYIRSFPNGLTCDACEHWSQRTHQCVSARINELMNMGEIVDSGRRERTRSRRLATVWKVAGGQKGLFDPGGLTLTDLRKRAIAAAVFARSTGEWASFGEALEELRKAESK